LSCQESGDEAQKMPFILVITMENLFVIGIM